jgi:single-strand DNA-binding protein
MSRSLNKVTLIGNLGSDPEIRATASGMKVAKVSLATGRTFQDKSGQTQEKTEWHRVTFFGKLADVVEQYVTKGSRLWVEGRIEYSQSQDEQGNVRYFTDIVANEMIMLGGSGGGGGMPSEEMGMGGGSRGGAPRSAPRSSSAPAPDLSQPDDDLPF